MRSKVTVVVMPGEEDHNVWVAYAPVLGMASQGDTPHDALRMVKDAIEGMLQAGDEETFDLLDIAHSPKAILDEVEVDVPTESRAAMVHGT